MSDAVAAAPPPPAPPVAVAPAAVRLLPAWLPRAPRFYAPAAILVALLAAATVFEQPPGLALTLTGLALFALGAAAAPERDPWRLALWGLASGLACMATLRDADWVREPALLASLVLAGLAAGGFVTFRGAVATVLRGALACVPGPVFVLASAMARLAGRRTGSAMPVVRGVVLAALLLAPFAALFAAADAAFAEWLEVELPSLGDVPLRALIAAGVLAVAGGLLRVALDPAPATAPTVRPLVGRTEWLIALGALNGLFLAFLALQLATLFGGHDHVLRTAGLTYAQYAREGFGQLVAVAVLTLLVISAARRWTLRAGERDERLQRLLLGGLCVLTLVVLVSAHRRLGLYVDAFGMTQARAFAQWLILSLAGLLLLVLLAHARPWLPRAAVAYAGLAFLLFGLSNPDARIAETNVERYRATGKIDTYLLMGLSADAAPALHRLTEREGCRDFRPESHDGLAGFNLARHRAHRLRCR